MVAPQHIYVASSWKNPKQVEIVRLLRSLGHEVFDFRNPEIEGYGFNWDEVDPNWKEFKPSQVVAALDRPVAQAHFELDYKAMRWATCCVLVLPAGRSSHIEAGWFAGSNRELHILLDQDDLGLELMYRVATKIHPDVESLTKAFA